MRGKNVRPGKSDYFQDGRQERDSSRGLQVKEIKIENFRGETRLRKEKKH